MRSPTRTRLSLDQAFLGFIVLGALVFFGATFFFVNDRVARLQDDILRSAIALRGQHLSLDIVNHLEDHWTDLTDLATLLPFSDRMTFRSYLTREVADGQHVVWAAYVTMQGDVAISSRQQRERQNVASEEWFVSAQRGPVVGFADDSTGEQRLHMTIPVRPTGSTGAGYLTFQFRPEWFEARLSDIARSMIVDVVIFDDRGAQVFQTFDVDPADTNQVSARNALAGQATTTFETWAGLGPRHAISVPELPASSLPAMGWRMVVLTPPDQFGAATAQLRLALFEILGAVALALLVMSIGFVRIFLVPLHRLVMNAHDIADGADIVPMEHHRTTELSLLSSAIARMQGRMLRAEDRLAEIDAKGRGWPSDGPN